MFPFRPIYYESSAFDENIPKAKPKGKQFYGSGYKQEGYLSNEIKILLIIGGAILLAVIVVNIVSAWFVK